MTVLQSIALGAIQGVAEFLPISSSGHLALTAHFMELSEVPLLFDILLHVASLVAVILVFRKRIGGLFFVFGRFIIRKPRVEDSSDQKMILSLIVATIVTGIIGFAIKDMVKTLNPFFIACGFVVTGCVLLFSGKFVSNKPAKVPGVVQGLIIGLAQGIGVIPGISRSGSTISASLFCGIDRKTAGEFSFLLSIPAIIAAFIFELKDADTLIGTVSPFSLIAGMLTAFVVGYFSLKFLLSLIKKGRLGWFAFYLIPVGIVSAVYFALTM